MSGLGDTLAVVSLSLTLLNGCVQGLRMLSKATHYDRDVSNIQLQFELKEHFLITWAQAAGLIQEPPTLLIGANDAQFVPKILDQLNTLLCDIHQLKKRYNIELKVVPQEAKTTREHDDSALSKLGPKPHESVQKANAAVFHKWTRPWNKLRWVTLDEKKIEHLMHDVSSYITELEKFLERSRQAKRAGDLDSLLRDAVLNLHDQQKLEVIGRESKYASSEIAIAAAVRLKQTMLKLGLSVTPALTTTKGSQSASDPLASSNTSSVHPGLPTKSSSNFLNNMRLPMHLLTMRRTARAERLRTLTHYDKAAVLLEWKTDPLPDSNPLEQRVNQVAAFLHHLEPSFHSLPCKGYVKDHNPIRYGYIFELPETPASTSMAASQSTLPSLPKLFSLRQLFDQSLATPSLNERLSISITLLQTLLNLHTTGWLHKELRSDNIILVGKAPDVEEVDVNLSLYTMYVAGYIYARADSPDEMTEPVKSELKANLYRHPLSLGNSRLMFRKSFDIFSVGCTLLEIGLWSSFSRILERHSGRVAASVPLSGRDRTIEKRQTFSSTSTGGKLPDSLDGEGGDHDDLKSIDLMMLRDKLLLSQLPMQSASRVENRLDRLTLAPHKRCGILRSLEAATGNLYTSIVEEFLSMKSVSFTQDGVEVNEHEHALNLEIKANATVQAIAKAI